MKRIKIILAVLELLFSMIGSNNANLTTYDDVIKASPNSITCTTTTIDNVVLLGEYVAIVSNISEKSGVYTVGVAPFETNGNIYMFGHRMEDEVGSSVFKADRASQYIYSSDLIGTVISNSVNGVVAESDLPLTEYSTIPIAKTIQLGDAFLLERDYEGTTYKYPITIEAITTLGEDQSLLLESSQTEELETFDRNQSVFFFSSSEIDLCEGMSGSPIIQNNELIGVYFGSMETDDGKRGIAWVIWDLDIVHP